MPRPTVNYFRVIECKRDAVKKKYGIGVRTGHRRNKRKLLNTFQITNKLKYAYKDDVMVAVVLLLLLTRV